MISSINRTILRLIDLGATYDTTYFEASLRVIFNRILLVIITASFLTLISELINGHTRGSLFAFIFILLELMLLWLSSRGKFRIAAFIMCSVLPLAITFLSIAYTDLRHLAFYFSVFALMTFFYIKNVLLRNTLVIIQLLCYTYSNYYSENYGSLFGVEFSEVSNVGLVLVFGMVFITVSMILLSKLINNEILYSNNIHSLEVKKDQLLQANSQLAKFSAVASHDMKTPLRTIHSFVGLIELKIKQKKYDELNELIELVKVGTEQMKGIIDEALNYDPKNDPKIGLQYVDLQEIVENNYLYLMNNYGDFEYEVLNNVPLKTHKSIINKLILNLMENGLKYNDKSEKKLWINQKLEGNTVYFSVADNGIGIQPSKRDLIFEIYERLDNGMNMEGSGLGLAICKGILTKIDGKIWVDEDYHDGTKINFSIPKDQFSLIV